MERGAMQKRICFFLCLCLCLLSVVIPASADTNDPIGRMTFFGESTTAHLALRGGISPTQVWTNSCGTLKLDSGILSRTLLDPANGSAHTVAELATAYHPEILVLSFGLNGIMTHAAHTELYLRNYRRLIDAIRTVSPSTRIVVQSIYPVADQAHQADWRFSVSPEEINRKIAMLNTYLRAFCEADGALIFAETSCALRDANGYLRADLTIDGIHLTADAYREILAVLRQCGSV